MDITIDRKFNKDDKTSLNEIDRDWRVMEFNAPIKESLTEGGNFIIKGIAINETTTRNGITYIAEELSMAAESFRDKPILKDHEARIDNIVGRTTENVNWSEELRAITFEAVIKDKGVQKMIEDGLVKNVSIGARVENIIENDDGDFVAKGMEGLELSLVAVPGDAGAGISQAMRESFKIKEMINNRNKKNESVNNEGLDSIKLNKEVIKMTNEQMIKDAAQKAVEEYKVEQEKLRVKEEAEKVEAERLAAEEKVKFDKAVADKVAEELKTKEDADAEANKDAVLKGQVNDGDAGNDATDENYVVESAEVGNGYSMYSNDVSKYNRLAR